MRTSVIAPFRLRVPSRLRLALLALSAAAALALAGCASAPDSGSAQPGGQAPAPTSTASDTCTYPAGTRTPSKEVTAPPAEPDAAGDVPVTIATSIGDLAVTLDADTTPCTVNSFLSLAQQGYFDGTNCHRLTTEGIFVLQCGDPTGTGTGGPGYSFPDELDGTETYPAGTLAMANAGPDTNGSQFFIVYADTQLPPSYTVFGHLDEASTSTVADVAAAGTESGGPDGAPKTPVTITGVTRG
ncbi:peptidylprolyl isomerase [Microbacterium suwonense]|uniref:Peptidyl-prolyl cis-trans isomerase n=1 Tax=Microbacterium suwonense TaxID=683047 RepID=A0ABM8FUP0_9MICO|nr:peptidylprolyl isomerase [Microbacterium suwonense]BDZ39389.1 peptidyl-prolyl cis-trans isomerase [Microbacterium suwonense]